jgi:hypothetical protein
MLNDATVLRDCIPGCETLEGTPEEGFSARVTTKVGPVKATFNGAVTLSNVNAPESYTISGEGKGGVAGFAKGGADVHLAEDGTDTVLTYVANAQVGGKLAQLGARLIDSTAKKLADQFFACFAERAGAPLPAGVSPGAIAAAPMGCAPDITSPAPDVIATSPAPEDIIMAGQAIPPAGTNVPIVEGQAAAPETVPPLAPMAASDELRVDPAPLHHGSTAGVVRPATTADNSAGASVQSLAREAEQEIEREAAAGFLGGPIVWGLLLLLVLLLAYTFAM